MTVPKEQGKTIPAASGRILPLLAILLLVSACATLDPYPVHPDNAASMARVDHDSAALLGDRLAQESEKLFDQGRKLRARMARVSPMPVPPRPAEPAADPLDLVRVSVDADNDDIQHVLRALAAQAGMNLLLDPELSGIRRRITLHLKDVPAGVVFRNLMELMDLHGEVQGNVMIVRPLEEKIFSLDFLQSATTMKFNIGGDIFGATASSGEGGAPANGMTGDLSLDNGGNAHADVYDEIEKMLRAVIGRNLSPRQGGPRLPPGAAAGRKDGKAGEPWIAATAGPGYSLNRTAGTLYVRARPSRVRTVSELVRRCREVLGRQVLIEAQILDVSLNDRYSYGIDWAALRNHFAAMYGAAAGTVSGVSAQLPVLDPAARTITLPAMTLGGDEASLGVAYSDGSFTSALNLLGAFGTVHVLSSPTIRAMNARPAFISVGTSLQYIARSSSTVTNTGGGAATTSADVTTSSVFDGIILGVEPFIDDQGTIHLTVHPMQSSVKSDSLALVDAGGGSRVTLPVIDFKGMTTSLRMNSGDTVIIGGLTNETGADSGDGIVGLSRLPVIGKLFGGRSHRRESRELVIIIRVTRLP